jgi:hypothetical protein
MAQKGFPPDDPLWQLASRARVALQDLHVATHYLAVGDGVGLRSSQPTQPNPTFENVPGSDAK